MSNLLLEYELKFTKLSIDNVLTSYVICSKCNDLYKLDSKTSINTLKTHWDSHSQTNRPPKRTAPNPLVIQRSETLPLVTLSSVQRHAMNVSLMENLVAGLRISYNAATSLYMEKFIQDILKGNPV